MDADGSHRAIDLPRLLGAAVTPDADGRLPDAVIGSRWVPGGSVVNWPIHRKILSRGGNTYTRLMLGMPVHDATAGFRVYPADTLRAIRLDAIESHGYCFQVDMTWHVARYGGRVVEVPITFVERQVGTSKMSNAIVAEALRKTTAWGIGYRFRQLRALVNPGARISRVSRSQKNLPRRDVDYTVPSAEAPSVEQRHDDGATVETIGTT
jgi:dolichol-phosphate mannosyltransferase